jgi:hypothetical protein
MQGRQQQRQPMLEDSIASGDVEVARQAQAAV